MNKVWHNKAWAEYIDWQEKDKKAAHPEIAFIVDLT